MKILTLHCDYITFKPLKKALKTAEELKQKGEITVKEPLVVLMAVERGDNDKTVAQLIDAIKKTASEVKTENIVLYPYAHLSPNLAHPDTALEYMVEAEQTLKKCKYNVTRAPFGYYKEFELKVKGHPLSELSKEFNPESLAMSPKALVTKKQEEKSVDPKRLLREVSKTKLDTSKLKDNDHRILGQRLDLFSFHEVAPGMVFWHDKGKIILDELIRFWKEEHRKEGYQLIQTPQIMDSKLWKISGHWEKYKENNFVTRYENRDFLVKPMNCPGGMIVFKSRPKSYKDFPIRVGELGIVHRTELSGVLAGLFRLIQFTQDDAHIFCANEEQVEEEIINVIRMVKRFYEKFNIKIDHVELSTRPEKRIGTEEMWDTAESILKRVLEKVDMQHEIKPGEGAFYGPKIDFHVKDSQGRTWQLSTIQLDFAMPQRFELTYIDSANKIKRPITLHRVIYGAMERFIGVLLEHLNGNLPVWLSPVQVRVINFTDRNLKNCENLMKQLKEQIPLLRIDSDFRSTTVSDKVRDAELQKIPYVIVIGDKEEESKTLAVRERNNKPRFKVQLSDFVKEITEKISSRT